MYEYICTLYKGHFLFMCVIMTYSLAYNDGDPILGMHTNGVPEYVSC